MGIIVIPGIEVQTKEEAHVICLFRSVNVALEFQNIIYDNMNYMRCSLSLGDQ